MVDEKLSAMVDSYVETALVYAAVRAGLPELLADGPADAAALARRGEFLLSPFERLLRGWEMIGLCARLDDGRYALSETGAALAEDAESPWRDRVQLVVEQYAPAFHRIDVTLRENVLPFELAHGLPPFAYRRAIPHADRLFNRWLAHETGNESDSITRCYDWSRYEQIIDVAGGEGSLLQAIANLHGKARLTLFEQEHLIERLARDSRFTGSAPRIELIAGDMFQQIPTGAQLYIVKSVLHDWNDHDALRLLRNIRTAMPPDARLLIIERLLDETGPHSRSTVLIDLHMLAVTGGMERKLPEFATLLEKAGFEPPEVIATQTVFYLLETTPSGSAA